MKENILICIHDTHDAERLIQRGRDLSNAFGGECFVLRILKDEEEAEYEFTEEYEILHALSSKYHTTLLIQNANKQRIADIISKKASSCKIKQIVLGQPARTKWDILMHGSIINDLLTLLKGVDLHIVEVSKGVAVVEKKHEMGVMACLVPKGDHLFLQFEQTKESQLKGYFFQDVSTDFQSGVFKVKTDDTLLLYKVVNGVASPSEVIILR